MFMVFHHSLNGPLSMAVVLILVAIACLLVATHEPVAIHKSPLSGKHFPHLGPNHYSGGSESDNSANSSHDIGMPWLLLSRPSKDWRRKRSMRDQLARKTKSY